jgi:hypothetical protein
MAETKVKEYKFLFFFAFYFKKNMSKNQRLDVVMQNLPICIKKIKKSGKEIGKNLENLSSHFQQFSFYSKIETFNKLTLNAQESTFIFLFLPFASQKFLKSQKFNGKKIKFHPYFLVFINNFWHLRAFSILTRNFSHLTRIFSS